jgi:hypothetical protein
MRETRKAVERAFVENSGRVLASLIGTLDDFDLAEDAMQEAFLVAMERWPTDGIPSNPGGWITLTARRKAIDRLRRDTTFRHKLAALHNVLELEKETQESDAVVAIPDERLKLIFTCCHPALAITSRVSRSPSGRSVGSQRSKSPGLSLSPSRRWHSVWCERSARSGTPVSLTGCLPPTCWRIASTPYWPSST